MHETVCTNIAGEVLKKRDLCAECFEVAKPTEPLPWAGVSQASCRYCGGKPVVSGSGSSASLSAIQSMEMTFQCGPCAEEAFRFLEQKWPGFGECARTATITEELIATMQKCDSSAVYAELEEHMKKWVAERDSQ